MNTSLSAASDAARAHHLRDRLPPGGLFADQEWRTATEPFPLEASFARELESLGRVLLQFYRAANLLYRHSVEGRQPGWVAEWLDRGKPGSILDLQRHRAFRHDVPRVIRPDILLTEAGFAITELDSVPGGIGLTDWLHRHYAETAADGEPSLVGGPDGMRQGFAGIFGDAPRVHLVVSEESSSYRPEMAWLGAELGSDRFQVQPGDFDAPDPGDAVYRFFELFDLDDVPGATGLFEQAVVGSVRLTPPPKAFLEEKALLALLWNRNLAAFWRRELGDAFLRRLQQHVPYSWFVDPAPLPPHGAVPGLDLTDWHQLKGLSQKERALILKPSGFSPEAWGARGVSLGSDLSVADWSQAVDRALADAGRSPWVLQRYHKPRRVTARWFDFERNEAQTMEGRVRLCPYYFVRGDGDTARARLGGVLATVCPADKKIIHGMREAILAPCVIRP
ncbi:MAG: hypothetical protein H7A45_06845 [Verrucomicrobiales bacterium]|nr:hypothetical protein [Verrucomicrobiales bacterium]